MLRSMLMVFWEEFKLIDVSCKRIRLIFDTSMSSFQATQQNLACNEKNTKRVVRTACSSYHSIFALDIFHSCMHDSPTISFAAHICQTAPRKQTPKHRR